jgi:hypothetical protein
MPAAALYDFEVIVPTAVKTLAVAAGLNAWTISDTPDFQKIRPRVEIVYQHTGEQSPRRVVKLDDVDGFKRAEAFQGELKLHAITDADPPGNTAHSAYRATVRAFCATLGDLLNESALPYHKIQWCESGQEQTGVRTQDGYQQTTFPFKILISVQRDAWAQLQS